MRHFIFVFLVLIAVLSRSSFGLSENDLSTDAFLTWSKYLKEQGSSRSEVSAKFNARSRLSSAMWSEEYRCKSEDGEFSYGTIIENCLKRFDTYYCTATVTVYCRETENPNE